MEKLNQCPCGRVPEKLNLSSGQSIKYAYASGDCCEEWNIEFKTKYYSVDQPEIIELAVEAWNSTVRNELIPALTTMMMNTTDEVRKSLIDNMEDGREKDIIRIWVHGAMGEWSFKKIKTRS